MKQGVVRSIGIGVVATLALTGLDLVAPKPASAAAVSEVCKEGTPILFALGTQVGSRPQTVVQRDPKGAICEFEQKVLREIAAERGTEWNGTTHRELLSYGRGVARDRMFTQLAELALRPTHTLTEAERGAVEWFDRLAVEALRVPAQISLAEYEKWKQDPCAYKAPEPFEYKPSKLACGDGALQHMFRDDPRPPSYDEFVAYGMHLAYDELTSPRGNGAVLSSVLGATTRVASTTAITIAFLFQKVLRGLAMPFRTIGGRLVNGAIVGGKLAGGLAAKILTKGGVAAFGGPVGVVAAIVLTVAIEVIIKIIEVLQDKAIPRKLRGDLGFADVPFPRRARTLLLDEGRRDAMTLEFMKATAPEYPPYPTSVPSTTPPADAMWFRIDPVTATETKPTYTQKIVYVDPVDGDKEAWLVDKWWVTRPLDGSSAPVLVPGLRMLGQRGHNVVAFDGKRFKTQRIADDASYDCPSVDCLFTPDLRFARHVETANRLPLLIGTVAHPSRTPTGAAITGAQKTYAVGQSVAFGATGASPSRDPLTYRWDLLRGDFEPIQHHVGDKFTTTLVAPGRYTLRMRATNPVGLFDEATVPLEVTGDEPLKIQTIDRYPGDAAASVKPLAEGTTSPEARIRVPGAPGDRVELDVNADGKYEHTGVVAPGATYVDLRPPKYRDDGLYPLHVRLTPARGRPVVRWAQVPVANIAPAMKVELKHGDNKIPRGADAARYALTEGDSINGTVTVTEPGTDEVDVVLRWADGTFETLYDVEPGQPRAFKHAFFDDTDKPEWRSEPWGPGLVAVAADDDGAESAPSRFYLHVRDRAPVIAKATVRAASPERVARVTVQDVSPGDFESVTVDFGDGTPLEELMPAYFPNDHASEHTLELAGPPHAYAKAGTYNVTITVHDDHPEKSVSVTRVVKAPGPPPTIEAITSAAMSDDGRSGEIEVELADPDDAPDALELLVDWGDGKKSTAQLDPSTGTFRAAHGWAAPAAKVITLTAKDAAGNVSDFVTLRPETAKEEVDDGFSTIAPSAAPKPEGASKSDAALPVVGGIAFLVIALAFALTLRARRP